MPGFTFLLDDPSRIRDEQLHSRAVSAFGRMALLTGASFVARLATPEGIDRPRFEVFVLDLGTPAFPILGKEGYLVYRPSSAGTLRVPVTGRRWGGNRARASAAATPAIP